MHENDKVGGYEIKRAISFENDRGFALGENPQAVSPFATWQFTEENGRRDYYWGHYTADKNAATRDYENRISTYQHDYGLSEKSAYRYYSTQRPVDIGTFPKTENDPLRVVNFDARENVEQGRFMAWGFLVYDAPLTEKQIDDFELRAAPDNPGQLGLSSQQSEKQTQLAIRQKTKPSIAGQLAEGVKRAEADNAMRPAAKKTPDKDR